MQRVNLWLEISSEQKQGWPWIRRFFLRYVAEGYREWSAWLPYTQRMLSWLVDNNQLSVSLLGLTTNWLLLFRINPTSKGQLKTEEWVLKSPVSMLTSIIQSDQIARTHGVCLEVFITYMHTEQLKVLLQSLWANGQILTCTYGLVHLYIEVKWLRSESCPYRPIYVRYFGNEFLKIERL